MLLSLLVSRSTSSCHSSTDTAFSGTSDADYHCLWIHLAVAVKKWNIRELKQIHIGERFASPAEEKAIREEAEALRKRIMQEALHGALRISALSGVLAQNSYLRLDPYVNMLLAFKRAYADQRALLQEHHVRHDL